MSQEPAAFDAPLVGSVWQGSTAPGSLPAEQGNTVPAPGAWNGFELGGRHPLSAGSSPVPPGSGPGGSSPALPSPLSAPPAAIDPFAGPRSAPLSAPQAPAAGPGTPAGRESSWFGTAPPPGPDPAADSPSAAPGTWSDRPSGATGPLPHLGSAAEPAPFPQPAQGFAQAPAQGSFQQAPGHGSFQQAPGQGSFQQPPQRLAQPRPGLDPESTAAWSLHDAADEPETFQPGAAPPAREAWSGHDSFEPAPPAAPILPDSWFADSPATASPADTGAGTQVTPMGVPPNPPHQGGFGAPQNGQHPAAGEPWPAQQQPFGSQNPGPYAQPHAQQGGGWGPQPQTQWGAGPVQNETAVLGAPGGPGFGPGYPQQEYMGQGPGFPPGDQHYRGEGQGGKSNRPLVLLVVGLVGAAVLAVGYVMWPSGGGGGSVHTSPSAGSTKDSGPSGAHDQATAVDGILDQSAKSRSQLNGAISEAGKCDGLDAAIAKMQQVATDRQQQVDKTNALKVDKLQNGTQLRDSLTKAITASLNVDKSYLLWAQASKGCHGKPKSNADKRQGEQLSGEASTAKQEFAKLWGPVADKEGLHNRGTSF